MARKNKDDVVFEGLFIGAICLGAYLTWGVTPEQREKYIGTLSTIGYGMLAFGIVTVICATLLAFYVAKKKRSNKPLPYFLQILPTFNLKKSRRKKEFLTPPEKEFKNYLRQNLPDNIEIQCKVRLADILKKETSNRRVCMMHVDFALLNTETQEIILVLELDDKSHDTEEAKERDAIKDNALKESKIHIARVPENKKYDPAIMGKIVKFCKSKTS